MKRFFLMPLVCISLAVMAWDSPISLPDIGNARLHIVGQNAQNYLTDFTASNKSCWSWDEFNTKTDKMANVFIALDADIVALCEVQRNDTILGYLCRAMNFLYGDTVYTYIKDGIEGSKSADGYVAIKSGFIYRKDKVQPVGEDYSPYSYSSQEYFSRLRIQTFKEIATDELFTLSVNHFKAKSGGYDSGESTRMTNVKKLLDELRYIYVDPDILIMGDLNAYPGERPIDTLIQKGYEEQLLRFDENAYSYNYQGQRGLLDHAFANSSMAEQITGAQVYHINNGNYQGWSNYHYSDHDAYVVGINLGEEIPQPIEDSVPASDCPAYEYDFRTGRCEWSMAYHSNEPVYNIHSIYGLQINAYSVSGELENVDQWLISPALDLSGATSATLTLNHNIYYDNGEQGDYERDQTVWISTDFYTGNIPTYDDYTWTPLPLSQYAVKNYVDATATIPSHCLTNNVHIAFRYKAPVKENANYWEIKTAKITTECNGTHEAIDHTPSSRNDVRKVLLGGNLYILYNGQWFDIMGNAVR